MQINNLIINYLNENSIKYLDESFLILENIFSLKAWSEEHEKEIKQAIDTLKQETKKEINKGIEAFKKNYKEDYEFIKFHNIPFLLIADTFEKFKKLFDKLHKIDSKLSKVSAKEIYNELKKFGPATIIADINEKNATKKFKNSDKNYEIPFISIPEKSFFERILLKGDLLGFFTKPSWLELEKQISIYHESVEFNEFSNKRFHIGNFFVKFEGDFYRYGHHYSIFVLAKEAIVLNKFKYLEAIKALREFRRKYEWRIIKAKTGIDFGKLTKLTPEIIKKLERIKPEKFGDEEGLFLEFNDLKFHPVSKTNSNIIKKFKAYRFK